MRPLRTAVLFLVMGAAMSGASPRVCAQAPATPDSAAVLAGLKSLRGLPDADRWKKTRELAAEIAQLPPGDQKIGYAEALSGLST